MRPFDGEKRRREDRWDKVDARFQWKSMGSRSGGGGDKCSLTLSMQCSGAGIDDDEIGFLFEVRRCVNSSFNLTPMATTKSVDASLWWDPFTDLLTELENLSPSLELPISLGKSKDGILVREDMVEMGIRPELAPIENPGKRTYLPAACYTMSNDEKTRFCKCLHGVKVPSGYSSNIKKLVSMSELKLFGMKSHDCHALTDHMIPIAKLLIASTEVSGDTLDGRLRIAKESYYGVIQEIWELKYLEILLWMRNSTISLTSYPHFLSVLHLQMIMLMTPLTYDHITTNDYGYHKKVNKFGNLHGSQSDLVSDFLGVDDEYIFQYSQESRNFWGSELK
ncbi:hypothetical protein LXL04_004815 [Taraxacum kok-saghyz]